MKLLIVLRIFAFMLFMFLPSIAVMLFAGFVLQSNWWFQLLSLPTLLVNGIVAYAKPSRRKIGEKLRSIAGLK